MVQVSLNGADEHPICWFSLQLTHQAPLWGVEKKDKKTKEQKNKYIYIYIYTRTHIHTYRFINIKLYSRKQNQSKYVLFYKYDARTRKLQRICNSGNLPRRCGLTSLPETWAAPQELRFPFPSSDCRCVRWRWLWRPRTRVGPWRSRSPWEQPPRTDPGGNLLLSAIRQTTLFLVFNNFIYQGGSSSVWKVFC